MNPNPERIPPFTLNRTYVLVVTFLTFVFPVAATMVEYVVHDREITVDLFGKWFIFTAVGVRLFLAGIRQISKPAFTAQEIFHINSPESLPIVQELGFANLCFGMVGLISLFLPNWRVVSAFASGMYYGLAGLLHLVKKPAGANEKFALWTDLVIFTCLTIIFIKLI